MNKLNMILFFILFITKNLFAEDTLINKKSITKTLPSKSGPHIEKIKALGDNEWYKLPPTTGDTNFSPARQGTVRSWSPKACYDAELGGAIITGEGAHGWVYSEYQRYSDDVLFFDLYANRWMYLYPGTFITDLKQKIETGQYKVDTKQLGVLVDSNDNPLPIAPMSGHGACYQSYDKANKKFIFIGSTFTYFFPKEPRELFQLKRKELGLPINTDCFLWSFDLTNNSFQPISKQELKIEKILELNRLGGRQVIQYVDSKNMHFWSGDNSDYWLDMKNIKVIPRPINNNEPRLPFKGKSGTGAGGSGCNSCYDPKNDRIYMGGSTRIDLTAAKPSDNFLYYDVKLNIWIKPNPKGNFPLTWDIGEAFMYFDTNNEKVVIMMANQHVKNKESRIIYIYDPYKNEFSEPLLVNLELPIGLGHCFFSPELNVCVIQIGRGDNSVPETWAYRLRKSVEKK
jgi:hypothetical protein